MLRLLALICLALLVVASVVVWAWSGHDDAEAPKLEPSTVVDPAAAPPVEPRVVTLPSPVPATSMVAGYIAYPDGTFLPPLNGVEHAPRVAFHPRIMPFTPVVGLERDATGREWYVHEDGTRSTTYLDRDGRAIADVQKPAPAQPMLPDESAGR